MIFFVIPLFCICSCIFLASMRELKQSFQLAPSLEIKKCVQDFIVVNIAFWLRKLFVQVALDINKTWPVCFCFISFVWKNHIFKKPSGCWICVNSFWMEKDAPLRLPGKRTWSWRNKHPRKKHVLFFTFMQWLMVCSLKKYQSPQMGYIILILAVLLESWQWVTQNRRNF